MQRLSDDELTKILNDVESDRVERNGNPPLEFDVDQGFVNVILRGKK
jgi:hypothetical protein